MNLRLLNYLVIALCAAGFDGCFGDQGDHYLPNIIIIYADDLGYGDISCQNPDSKIQTPNIDQLARDGMRFTDAHSTSAVCTPSRYALLTGRYPWRTELKKGVLWEWDGPLIKKERLTLAEILKEKNYTTAAIGKWHLGWDWPTNDGIPAKSTNGENVDYSQPILGGPLDYGFDYYFGDDVPNFPPYCFIENNKVTEIPGIKKPDSLFGKPGMMVKGWKLEEVMPIITEKAIHFINQACHKDQPFFLYFALTAPHTPIAPVKKFIGISQAGLYGDYVQEVDWTTGQIMKALELTGQVRNTMIIFTSDNGSPCRDGTNWSGEIGSVRKYNHSPNGSLRGYKGDLWEGGHRIPFIVRWPENTAPKQMNNSLICQIDVFATIAGIVEYELPYDSGEDSYDLSPLLFGEKTGHPIRESLIHQSYDGALAVRKGDWKLILTNKSGGFSDLVTPEGYGISTPGQLYNLSRDHREEYNLYPEHLEQVKELTNLMEQYIEQGRSNMTDH